MLEVKNLHKEFDKVIAVNNLDLTIQKGEIVGLLGPNGAGKTTTIRCIMNIIKPDSGRITLDGKELNPNLLNQFGYLPEERGLYSKSKVIDVITYFGELKGLSASSVKKLAAELLRKLQIPEYAQRKVNELSKGNQQKIQLITSILHKPKFLILDEPFSGLDPINQQIVKDLILEMLDQGTAILLSTHQMDVAEKLCRRIILINAGEEVLSGSLTDVKKQFGNLSVIIKYKKAPNNFDNYTEIQTSDVYENYAELILKENSDTKLLMQKMINDLDILSFEIKEPSLNSIFITTIEKKSNMGK